MQLRALKEVFIRMERETSGFVFYIDTQWINPVHEQGYARIVHLRVGDSILFTNIQAGDNPYQTLADTHPDLLVIEQDTLDD